MQLIKWNGRKKYLDLILRNARLIVQNGISNKTKDTEVTYYLFIWSVKEKDIPG